MINAQSKSNIYSFIYIPYASQHSGGQDCDQVVCATTESLSQVFYLLVGNFLGLFTFELEWIDLWTEESPL